MATYTILGHPLNIADLATTPGGAVDPGLAAVIRDKGVGQSVTLTLAGAIDTKAKATSLVR